MKNLFVRIGILLLTVLQLAFTCTAQSTVVGSMKGTPAVTPAGAFTYSIPLALPPGIKHMVPQLAISYNSMAADGLLGYGWDISGISSITRVPSDVYHDHNVNPVNYNGDDAFMLNGKRLIQTGPSTYETSIKDFSRITATSTASGGVQHFIVEDKDGLIYEYGNTPNAQMMAPGSSYIFTWALNRVTDRNGNHIDFTYTNSSTYAVYYISGITYGGNTSAGTTPDNEIIFNYEVKSDKNFQYIHGAKIMSDVKMTEIVIKNSGAVIHKYGLEYTLDFYSHLAKIKETGEGGSQLPPTLVTWGTETTPTTGSNTSILREPYYGYTPFIADFDGDGLSDIADVMRNHPLGPGIPFPHYKLYKNTHADNFSFVNEGDLPFAPGYANDEYQALRFGFAQNKFAIDYNGDGKDDIITTSYDEYDYYMYLHITNSAGDDFDPPLTLFHFTGTPAGASLEKFGQIRFAIGDFTGTKKMSVLAFSPNDAGTGATKSYTTYLKGDGFLKEGTFTGQVKDFNALDYDGDGKDELFITSLPGWTSTVYATEFTYSSTDGAPLSGALTLNLLFTSGYPNQGHRIYFGDFNGDGKRDILTWSGNPAPWEIGYSKGTGGFDVQNISSIGIETPDPEAGHDDNNIFIADFNGDGKDDILDVFHSGPSNMFNIFYSRGNNVFTNEPLVISDLCGISDLAYSIGDFNGDGKADLLESSYTGCYYRLIYFHKNEQKHLVHQIEKGDNMPASQGRKFKIEYGPVVMESDYANPSSPSYPYNQKAVSGLNVVRHLYDSYNGIDNVSINNKYHYNGLTAQKQGLGFKGFESFTVYNDITHKYTINRFDVLSFETATPKAIETYYTPTNDLMGLVNYEFKQAVLDNNIKLIYPLSEYELNYVNNSEVKTDFIYNTPEGTIYPNLFHFGSPDKVVTSVSGGQEVTTKEFIYGTWIPAAPDFYNQNKPKQTTTTVQRPLQPSYTRVTTSEYNVNGQVDNYTNDPVGTHINHVSNIFDGFGNVIQKISTATGCGARMDNYAYSTDGKFLINAINTVGHHTHYSYDKWGNTTSSKDINDLITTNVYDDFSRLVSTTSSTGVTTASSYQWAASLTSSCPAVSANPCYAVTNTVAGIAGSETAFFDYNGRKIRTVTNAFDGQPLYQDITYADNNAISQTTDPYIAGTTPNVTSFIYDNFDRVVQQITPTSTISTAYGPVFVSGVIAAGMKTVSTNTTASPVRTKETTIDGTGKPILITNGDSYIGYVYHSNGKLARTVINSSFVSLYTYDEYGNCVGELVPNKNNTVNVYNARDLVTKTTDANSNTFDFTYDAIGRVMTKAGSDGAYIYIYGTTPSTFGKVTQEIAPYAGTATTYVYDALSRLTQRNETINSSLFTTHYEYDEFNRVIQTTYPTGSYVANSYNSYGYFKRLTTSTGYPGLVTGIYEKKAQNVYGQTTEAFYAPYAGASTPGVPDPLPLYKETTTYNANGTLLATKLKNNAAASLNNYTYSFNEATGDLSMRRDEKWGLTEYFTYDILDRLTSAQQAASPTGIIATQNFDYSPEGNLLHKSDISSEPWQYNKYAVADIPNPTSVIPTFTQTATYTPFNKVKTVAEGDKKIVFSYRADNQRGMAQYYTGGVLTKTRYYATNYEKTVDAATGIAEEICYIGAEGKLVAMYVTNAEGTDTKYVVTDYQGSITHILNQGGSIDEERSYDAWGRMRNPSTWEYAAIPEYAYDRGYTGEELLKDFNIINLNGRLYDPLIGKMFSPDPVIGDIYNAQTLNAYSYALNNPLKYADRNGENPLLAAVIVGGLFNLAIEASHGRVTNFAQGADAFLIGAGATFVAVMGGGAVVGALGLTGGAAACIGGAVGGGIGTALTTAGNAVVLDDYDHNKSIGRQIYTNGAWGFVLGGAMGYGIYQLGNVFHPSISKPDVRPLDAAAAEECPVNPVVEGPEEIIASKGIGPVYDECGDVVAPFESMDGKGNLREIFVTSSKSTAPSRMYTIFDGNGQLYKFGVTDAELVRYNQSLREAGEGATGELSSIYPKCDAHVYEKYMRSLFYNSTGQYELEGMKIPLPRDFNTGKIIRP